jgi:hypothetical protein
MQYFSISRNKYKNYVLQNLSSEHIFYHKIVENRKSNSLKNKTIK